MGVLPAQTNTAKQCQHIVTQDACIKKTYGSTDSTLNSKLDSKKGCVGAVEKKRKVFNRKGSFSANENDPPIGPPLEILPEPRTVEPEPQPQTFLPVPKVAAVDTDCHELDNLRVRVLKPDRVFIRDITERLTRLDRAVRKLNANVDTED